MEGQYNPEFYIVYSDPARIMLLIQRLAKKKYKKPFMSPYSLLSICGNVFVRGYHSGDLCVSFGCPESRRYGGVGKNEAIVGFPGNIARVLFES